MKRILKMGLAVLALTALIGCVWQWRVQSQLESLLTELRDAGQPVMIADLAPHQTPLPSNNAATYLARASDQLGQLYNEIEPYADANEFRWQSGLSDDAITATEEAFTAHANALETLDQAIACSQLVWARDYTIGPTAFLDRQIELVQHFRTAARVLNCRARYLASIGKHDEAIQQYLAMLKFAKQHEAEPTLISLLANLAVRSVAMEGLNGILQTATVTHHSQIEESLRQAEDFSFITQCLISERAFGIESFRELSLPWLSLSSDWGGYLEYMKAQIALGPASPYEIPQPIAAPGGTLAALAVPAVTVARTSLYRSLTQLRCLRIINQKISRDAGVEIELPTEALVDPYTGTQLLQKQVASGWLVYSVGENMTDENGDVETGKDIGLAPPE